MEENKKQIAIRYVTGLIKPSHGVNEAIQDIDDRLSAIEARLFKTERKSLTTRAQQMLLLQHLGMLNLLQDFNLSNKKKAKLLSVLLNASEANIEDDLSAIHKAKSHLKSSHNYKVISKTFKEAGLKKLTSETDEILDRLINAENK